MVRADDLYNLPDSLPVPTDDGACSHLVGMALPQVVLGSTDGSRIDLGALTERAVVYCYPRTGLPDRDEPAGWSAIAGARGCTPQSCGFRDLNAEFERHGTRVFGLSAQETAYQSEAAERLHLPFPLLSDANFTLTDALSLPTFEVEGQRLLKRVTLIVNHGRIDHLFYPVFPPNTNAVEVISWLDQFASTA